jgi:tetratricopeptide (TPR) repeat protein
MAPPRGPRKRPRSPKEIRKIDDDEQARRQATPSERQSKLIIQLGVAVLVIAFLTTSGITFVNLNSTFNGKETPAPKVVSPEDAELASRRKEAQEKPNDPAVLANLAYFLIQKASETEPAAAAPTYAEAAADLQTAIKLDPNYAFALRLMGQLDMIEQKPDDAGKYYHQALEAASKPVDPKDKDKDSKEQTNKSEQLEAHLGLASVFEAQKKPADSLKEFAEALKIDPGSPKAYAMRAQVYQREGQKEQARKDLQMVMTISEKTGNAQFGRIAQMELYMLDETATPTPEAAASSASATPIQIIPPQLNPATQASATPAPTTPTASPTP